MRKALGVSQKQLVSDVARDIVTQISPQELPMFRAVNEAYFKDPEKTLKGKTGKDEMLGFGVGEAVTFLTPIALEVTSEVVMYVAEEAKKTFKGESSGIASDIVKKMFKKFRPAEDKENKIPMLTDEQLLKVRRLAFEKACQLNLPEAHANLLADSMVGGLKCYT